MSGRGIVCPACGTVGETVVKDSRQIEKMGMSVRHRRRRCLDCDHRWSTFELSEEDFARITDLRDASRAYWKAVHALGADE